MRRWMWVSALLVVLYAGMVTFYVISASSYTPELPDSSNAASDLTLVMNPDTFTAEMNALSVSITVIPSSSLLDPAGALRNSIGLTVGPVVQSSFILLEKGSIPDTVERTIRVEGSIRQYPFDRYTTPVVVSAGELVDGQWRPLTVAGGVSRENLKGWVISSPELDVGPNGLSPAIFGDTFSSSERSLATQVSLRRGTSTTVIVMILVALMVGCAAAALLVVRAVATGRRRQEMNMTSWFAALIFALIPLRLALPGAPPLGSLIDVLAVTWVFVSIIVAMLWWIALWLKGPRVEN